MRALNITPSGSGVSVGLPPGVEERLLPRALPGVGKRKKLADNLLAQKRLRARSRGLVTTIADIEEDLVNKKARLVQVRSDLDQACKTVAALSTELNFPLE